MVANIVGGHPSAATSARGRTHHNVQLVERIMREGMLSLVEAARHLGRKHHPYTLQRWVRPGLRGIRLEAVKIGRQWFTSTAAMVRFFAALQSDDPAAEFQGAAGDEPLSPTAARRVLQSHGLVEE